MIAPSPALPPPRQLHSAQIWLSDSDKRCSLPAGGADARPPSSGGASPRGPGRGPRPSGIPARRVRCPRPSVPASPHTFPQLGKVRSGAQRGRGERQARALPSARTCRLGTTAGAAGARCGWRATKPQGVEWPRRSRPPPRGVGTSGAFHSAQPPSATPPGS